MIGLVFQDTTLDTYLTAEQNLRFHATLYAVPPDAVEPRMRQVLDMVGLWDRKDGLVSTFSGGMQRRLEIARGLLHAPHVLVPRRADRRPRPADAFFHLGLYKRPQKTRGHNDLPDHALHGRGRKLRQDRHYRPRPDRGHRYSASN